jgi:hypothetical protein
MRVSSPAVIIDYVNKTTNTTIDHEVIREWAEKRDGKPAIVKDTKREGGMAVLRIDFGKPESKLQEISWEDFFKIFEERNLAFLYQDATADGKESRFFKFIDRENI